MSKEALNLALDVLKDAAEFGSLYERAEKAIKAIEALAKQEQGEPVTILPDGSAFGVMSFPLPDDHWIYAPNEYRDGEYEPIDLPNPILNHALRDAVVSAIRYAVRGATMLGQEMDFDPDALVQNAVYALCGPYTQSPQPKQEQCTGCEGKPSNTNNPCAICGKAKQEQRSDSEHMGKPVAWCWRSVSTGELFDFTERLHPEDLESDNFVPLYTTPQQRTWIGLTIEEREQIQQECFGKVPHHVAFAHAIEAKLKEKNT